MGIGVKNEGDEEIISDINLTPFIDVMLVLLIIFMITSSMSFQTGLDINVPSVASTKSGKGPEGVLVSLDHRGNLFVDGKKSSLLKLKGHIADSLKKASEKMVIFEGDKNSSLEKTLEIIDIAKEAGASKFAIAAREK